jgi:hypothetical protein
MHPESPAIVKNHESFFLVFVCPRAIAELVHKIPVALHAYHAAFPNINFKKFAKTQPSHRDQHFIMIVIIATG